MRSPILAFSILAAVSPTLVSSAPASPQFGNDAVTHPRNTEVKMATLSDRVATAPNSFRRADLPGPLGAAAGGAGGGLGIITSIAKPVAGIAGGAAPVPSGAPGVPGGAPGIPGGAPGIPGGAPGGVAEDAARTPREPKSGGKRPSVPQFAQAEASSARGSGNGIGNGSGNGVNRAEVIPATPAAAA